MKTKASNESQEKPRPKSPAEWTAAEEEADWKQAKRDWKAKHGNEAPKVH